MISLKLAEIRKQHLIRTKMLLLIFCLYHITQPAVCSWHVQLPQFKQKQQRNKKEKKDKLFTPVSETDMLSTTAVMWHVERKMCAESTAVMLCQTLRGEKNKPVNQLWQSLRGTMTTLFYCLANTEEISFHINFLCLHLFECKYDSDLYWFIIPCQMISRQGWIIYEGIYFQREMNLYATPCKNAI